MSSAFTLGIDPGSRRTGYAIVGQEGRQLFNVESGTITLFHGSAVLSCRLARLLDALEKLFQRYCPSAVAVEDIFTARNVRSALALGQARGIVLAVAGRHNLPVYAYPPATVKRAVVGHGQAEKQQVQRMVQVLLALKGLPAQDEADAMAIAICHRLCSHTQQLPSLG